MATDKPANGTFIGFDFGEKQIGIAVGQQITATAAPLGAIKAQQGVPDWSVLAALFQQWQPQGVVVGLPLNMDGSEQPVTLAAKKFANRIHGRFGLPIYLQDERLTTADAKARLFELGGYKRLQKSQIDSISAVLILENYLESQFD